MSSGTTDGQRQQTDDLAARIWMRTPAPTAHPRCRHVLDEGLRNTVVINVDYRDRVGVVTRGRAIEALGFADTRLLVAVGLVPRP